MNNTPDINTATNRELYPYILLQPYDSKITIGKDIIRSLGFPTHISLRINEATHSVAIIPCKPEDVMSFKVPAKLFTDHHCTFRIYSKLFLMTLLLNYDLDPTFNYEYKGIYSEKMNAVIFSLEQSNVTVKQVKTSPKEIQ